MITITFRTNTLEEERALATRAEKEKSQLQGYGVCFNVAGKPVEEEYRAEQHEAFKKHLEKLWQEQSGNFIEKLSDLLRIQNEMPITIRTTFYGALGYYNPETNDIYINMHGSDFTRIIEHEIVHLAIQDYVDTHHLPHASKELIVQKILETLEI